MKSTSLGIFLFISAISLKSSLIQFNIQQLYEADF